MTGVDTGVGKTVVAGLMARQLLRGHADVITVKLVQTGCDGFSEDLLLHRKLMGCADFPEDKSGLTAPQIFKFPSSPHLAAALEGAEVDIDSIERAVSECAKRHDNVIVEGAGGLAVPLHEDVLTVDFVRENGWKTILVTNGALGRLNHAIMSLESLFSRGMTLSGVVFNYCAGTDPQIESDTVRMLKSYLKRAGEDAPVVIVPEVSDPENPPDVDFSEIFAGTEPSDAARTVRFDREHIWHPYSSIGNPPPVFTAAETCGTRIKTEESVELIDAVSSWWCAAHGHSNPEIVRAIRRQASKMPHVMFAGFTHRPAAELAEMIGGFLPAGLDRVFFADSGSVSVECAAKMAVQYQRAAGRPSRSRLAALKGGYHGDTSGAMALSDPDGMHVLFRDIMPRHFFAEKPVSRFGGEWMPEDFDSMRSLAQEHGDEIAAVICEPVFQGGNAMWMYHPQYLRELRRLCDEYGFLLIFDEIATGFWRTGKLFAMDHAGVVPDIVCLGKALTGGTVTLAAAVASRRVADVISTGSPAAFMHGPTFMANPIACAAGAASLKLFRSLDYAGSVRRISETLSRGLSGLKGTDNVADVRVLGAIGVVELKNMPSPSDVRKVILDTGVWLRPFSNFVYTMPPLMCSDAELNRIAAAIRGVAECPPCCEETGDAGFHE